ncbi:MAG: ABC transporter substrate-binding protein [Neomegalonema sp.]|nr:ABC transporter substrate-binding protein [Neomegalonema sp.]
MKLIRAFAVFAGLAALSSAAAAQTAVKFALDWKFEGPAAPYFVAIDEGDFAKAGLKVTIDSGKGSLDAIPKVASGSYPFGFADINSLAKFLDSNPDAPVIAVMMVYDAPPFAIISTKSRGVAKPKDLEGKILGAPAPDGAYAQWKAFVAATGIDASKVKIENVGFPVREPMLAAGKVDAITGYSFSSYINLKAKGVPADDIVVMLMSDYGLKLYGNVVIVNTEFAKANPKVVTAFLGAIAKGWAKAVANPEAAIEKLLKRNDLAVAETETERLKIAIRDHVLTPYVAENGMGGVDKERFEAGLKQLMLTYAFKTPPSMAKLFTSKYLPPKSELMLK